MIPLLELMGAAETSATPGAEDAAGGPAAEAVNVDGEYLWYAGKYSDDCGGLYVSTMDPRVALVAANGILSPQGVLDPRTRCPPHPLLGLKYRWPTSLEILDLGTVFTGAAAAAAAAAGSTNGTAGGACAWSPLAPGRTRSAFLFADSHVAGVYANGSRPEWAPLAAGSLTADRIAGLVCILDAEQAESYPVCPTRTYPAGPGAVAPPAANGSSTNGSTTNGSNASGWAGPGPRLVLRIRQYEVRTSSGDTLTPTMDLDYGGAFVLQSGLSYGLLASLSEPPASWVSVSLTTPSDSASIQWDGPGPAWRFGVGAWLGQLASSADANAWSQELLFNLSCANGTAWGYDQAKLLTFTLTTHGSQSNSSFVFTRFPSSPVDVPGGPGDTGLYMPSVRPPTMLPEIGGPFCLRAGARWAVPGDSGTPEMGGSEAWCGRRVVAVDTGARYSCALWDSGRLVCWGANHYGQTSVPPQVAAAAVRSFSAGAYHACAIDRDAAAYCWGDGLYGKADVPQGHNWTALSAGTSHSCGVTSLGALLCWGDGKFGQLSAPSQPDARWASVSSGAFHACAVMVNGTGACWGGRSGRNSHDFGQTAVPSPDGPWRTLSAGNMHSCGLLTNGTALCWGSNTYGQLDVPAAGPGVTWLDISVGLMHTCGVRSDGSMHCWGASELNRLYVLPALPTLR